MAIDNRRCFSTIEDLRKFEPETLCRFLGMYPAYVAARLGSLPDPPDERSMPYDRIVPMFMEVGEDTPGDFIEKMILIIDMGKPAGNTKLQEEARRSGVAYASFRGKTLRDTAMRAAMLPGDLLDRAHARTMLLRKRRYAYYPTALGVVPEYHAPTPGELQALGDELTTWFHGMEPKIKAKVLFWDFVDEAWFLIRRGGQAVRMAVYDEDSGDAVSKFLRPETYDGIVYNKRCGELRIISRLPPDARCGYLARFGELLAGDRLLFGQKRMFHPERVAGMQREDLGGEDNRTVGGIRLAELKYQLVGGETVHRRTRGCLLRPSGKGNPVPAGVEAVEFVEFKFKFLSDDRERSVRVEAGNEATYLRDSDASLIEQWLRDKGLMEAAGPEKAADAKVA